MLGAMAMLASCAVGALAQQAQDPEAALRRTRERVLADLERMPRYTCVQTITRRYFAAEGKTDSCVAIIAAHEKQSRKIKLSGWDRLRLDVAIAGGENVYSWVGAPRFESGTLEELAGHGPLSSGDFGPFLFSIFNGAAVTYQGEERAGGKRLLVYSYEMSRERSKYSIKGGQGWDITAYGGTFRLDPEASDIVALTIRTAELPASNPDCQAISEIQYGRALIHDRMVLLPRGTTLVALGRDGFETHSLTTFASCREYSSNVRLLLDAPAGDEVTSGANAAAATSEAAALPAGLRFTGRLVTTIDSDTSAAGDPIELVLGSPIRDKEGQELAPAGARLHARLLGLEQHSARYDFFRVTLRFESIELNGHTIPLRAAPDHSLVNRRSFGGTPVFTAVDAGSEDLTAFVFPEEHLRLKKLEWNWITLPLKEEIPTSSRARNRRR
jgi:hypothetical protein